MIAAPILLYHSIAPDASPEYQPWCVHPDRFDAHLSLIAELGLQPMTVSDFVDARATGNLPPKPCLVTFDDGRRDFVEHALPILTAHETPATMYVVTDHIGGTSTWLPIDEERDQPMMNWDDVRRIAAAGIEVGAHSRTHAELDVVSSDVCVDEVTGSRDRLTDELNMTIRSFAYPHGYHSRSVIRAVRAAGFDSACAVNDRWCHFGDDRFALSRQFVWDSTTDDELRAMLVDAPQAIAPMHTLQSGAQRIIRIGWRAARHIRHRAATETP